MKAQTNSEKRDRVLVVIPARGGSKRLPRKNVLHLGGRPLIAYAIEAAKGSKFVDNVLVSTDNEEIATIARHFGATVPFIRPADLASDEASSVGVLQHAVRFYEEKNRRIDTIILVQPTSPGVEAGDIDACIEKLYESGANSCASVCEITDRPEYMYSLDSEGHWKPYVGGSQKRSQDMPKLYRLNGAVYAIPRATLMDANQIYMMMSMERLSLCRAIDPST